MSHPDPARWLWIVRHTPCLGAPRAAEPTASLPRARCASSTTARPIHRLSPTSRVGMTRKTDPHRTNPWEVAWQDVSSPTSQRISNPQYRPHVEAATEPLADQAAGRIEERLQALLTKRGLVKTSDDAFLNMRVIPRRPRNSSTLSRPQGQGRLTILCAGVSSPTLGPRAIRMKSLPRRCAPSINDGCLALMTGEPHLGQSSPASLCSSMAPPRCVRSGHRGKAVRRDGSIREVPLQRRNG